MKFNYQIIIEYVGQNFAGWQIQKNSNSIQAEVEKAISKTLRSKVNVIGSGRTDAGVNAIAQSANFFYEKKISNNFKFLSTVNYFLRNCRISILQLKKRGSNFHARRSAKRRQYEYIIINRVAKLAIDCERAWLVKKKLDIKEMKKGIKYFLGTHDFSAFRASSCTAKNPIKTISQAKVKKSGDKISILFVSKSFLQKQVRSMVGCLKYVGEQRWSSKKILKVMKSKKRHMCAPPAPAQGLFLKKIFY